MIMAVLQASQAWALRSTVDDVAGYVGVPADILYAMALTESGRMVDGEPAPWPWSLNVAGESRRFESRQMMFQALMEALGEGELSIDVGPMQVNWFWQYERVSSPWRLTDPAVNLKHGAQILKGHFERCGDWWEAVGLYHRPAQGDGDKRIADRYRKKVRQQYDELRSKEIANAV